MEIRFRGKERKIYNAKYYQENKDKHPYKRKRTVKKNLPDDTIFLLESIRDLKKKPYYDFQDKYHRAWKQELNIFFNNKKIEKLEEEFIGNFNMYQIGLFCDDVYYYYNGYDITMKIINKYHKQFLNAYQDNYGIKNLDTDLMALFFLYIKHKQGIFTSPDLKKYNKLL